ncbi:BTB/POZ domain-containing protein At2g13690-like [Vigna umbellata]|uniref:BTB/POZ domain-containing protein At2g13690-like n=1 Tax=Vigna umbellata TaxID=87088 RepID=UPI001F5F8A3D|nr:BTB/POZ domain-containing protein At2g13690-like [Vigna umbellata]XP_047169972.1 BTB/POZ domain-containing protein At2g13690-like [Vigna umbellata]
MDPFHHRRRHRRRTWCCSFAVPPSSPDNIAASKPLPPRKPEPNSKPTFSLPTSPKSRIPARIDPRRILSPGRVSPIDSDPVAATSAPSPSPEPPLPRSPAPVAGDRDVRMSLRGKNGGCMVLEVNSGVLCANSEVFAGLIEDYKKGAASWSGSNKMCRIEVPEVENLGVFRETIELMFENDDCLTKRLLNIGVFRCIDVLEVSAGIMFTKGVLSCLQYLEAVPWTEEEEEKLRSLFTRFKFDEATTRDILGRLYLHESADCSNQSNVARQLVWSIITCVDVNARNELKSLVKGLLCKSSVYEKNHLDLNKDELYSVGHACLDSLLSLFEEASDTIPSENLTKKDKNKPLIERISRQVDNINWLLEIMLDGQIAEDFVNIWADQHQLVKMHDSASPMIRYELSRVSAILFIAMATRKLQCRLEARSGLLQAWFRPMLLDFGWLQRCRRGLDIKVLQEAMGQTLLTLPLNQQYMLFMEWFRHFSSHGTECPNLSKAFQIWWRRSFLRGSETHAIESR